MITEKGLAEKVMFCIHIDSHHEVEQAFTEYFNFVGKLKDKKDNKLYRRVWNKYEKYKLEKVEDE